MTDATKSAKKAVGKQLAKRRRDRGLTQRTLADLIDMTSRTVSAIERGTNRIQSGNVPEWEKALQLVPGTIDRAYDEGTLIEVDTAPAPAAEETGPDVYDAVLVALTARLKRMVGGLEGKDDLLVAVASRLTVVEEGLDNERRAREALEQTMAKLGGKPPETT